MLADVLYILHSCIEGVFIFLIVIVAREFLFLEQHTERQNKITALLFFSGFTFMLAADVIVDVVLELGIRFNPDVLKNVYNVLYGITAVFVIISFAYSSIVGRRKAKWLGIFSIVPMIGLFDALEVVIEIPENLLEDKIKYPELITTALLGAVAFLFFIIRKKQPAFVLKYKKSVEGRTLTAIEEFGIWAVGIWLFIFDAFSTKSFESGAYIYSTITNLIVAGVILLLIYDSNYRRYYYQQNMQLQKTLITTMADLVENRDENTGGHIQRTAKYVEIISKQLMKENQFGDILTPDYIEDMIVAAPLHDVGKIHIPDAILNKAGRLDDSEFSVMKTHAEAGSDIIDKTIVHVGDITYLVIAKQMAEYHHERIDGKGYPHGLSGDEIPLCAKILAVADVFDALVSKRCYKEPMPLDDAFSIIKEEAGSHFDVNVAKAFLDSREEVVQYLSRRDENTCPVNG